MSTIWMMRKLILLEYWYQRIVFCTSDEIRLLCCVYNGRLYTVNVSLLYVCLSDWVVRLLSCVCKEKTHNGEASINSGAFKRASSVVSLLCGSQPKEVGKNFSRNPRCQICTLLLKTSNIPYFIFVCDILNDTRQRIIDDLIESIPLGMRTEYETMSHNNIQQTNIPTVGLIKW